MSFNISGYIVLYSTDVTLRDRDWGVQGVSRGDQLSTTIGKLTPATTYFFKVQARNKKGMSPFSRPVSFTTPPGLTRLSRHAMYMLSVMLYSDVSFAVGGNNMYTVDTEPKDFDETGQAAGL